jgi:hypothetical protein
MGYIAFTNRVVTRVINKQKYIELDLEKSERELYKVLSRIERLRC